MKYICSECQAHYSKWVGLCNHCQCWNTINFQSEKEVILNKNLDEIKYLVAGEHSDDCLSTYRFGCSDLDKFFKMDYPKGSLNLFYGVPGIGKTTFLFSTIKKISLFNNLNVAYVSTEELQVSFLKGFLVRVLLTILKLVILLIFRKLFHW